MFAIRLGVPVEFADTGPPVDMPMGAILARRFVLPQDDIVREVRFFLAGVHGGLRGDDILCEIRKDADGLPGEVLASTRTLDRTPDTSGPISAIGFDVALPGGAPYWFCIRNNNAYGGASFTLLAGAQLPLFLCDHYSAFSLDGLSWVTDARYEGMLITSTRVYGFCRTDAGSISVGNAVQGFALGIVLNNVLPVSLPIAGVQASCVAPSGWYPQAEVFDAQGALVGVYKGELTSGTVSLFPSTVMVGPGYRFELELHPIDGVFVHSVGMRHFSTTDSRLTLLSSSQMLNNDSFFLKRRRKSDRMVQPGSTVLPVLSVLLKG